MPPSQKISDNVELLHRKVGELLKKEMPESNIIDELKKDGVTAEYAEIIIANVQNDIHDRKGFWKLIVGGLFFIVGGLAINYFSYQIALNTGSLFFYLFWGIVVAGVVMLVKAFTIFKK